MAASISLVRGAPASTRCRRSNRCGKVQMVNEAHAPWGRGRSEHSDASSDIHTRRLQRGPILLNDRPNGTGLTGPNSPYVPQGYPQHTHRAVNRTAPQQPGRRVWPHTTTTPVGGGLPAPLSAVEFSGATGSASDGCVSLRPRCCGGATLRAPEGKCGSDARPGLPRPHKLLGRFSTDDEVERWCRDMFEQSRLGGKSATLRGAYALTSL